MSVIKVENLSHVYMPGTPFEMEALKDINLSIEKGEFVGLIGHTGSGKSTFIQHLNGLLKPTKGIVKIDDNDLGKKGVNIKKIRQKVGLIFQYPEHQLFEETVYKDTAFGPRNLDLKEKEIEKRVKQALTTVGLDYEDIKDRSPFELSGGQMRRVAIAGVLAMHPDILILDEPTAGLDPMGRNEILDQIGILRKKYNLTVILVSHSMEDIARMVDKIIVMDNGKIFLEGNARDIFSKAEELEKIGLGVPPVTVLSKKLSQKGKNIKEIILTVKEAEQEVLKMLRGNKNA